MGYYSPAEMRLRYGRPCACGCGQTTSGSEGRVNAPEYTAECSKRIRREQARERSIAAIQAWHRKHGRLPTAREWRYGVAPNPTTSNLQQFFGSWTAAMKAAGFEPRKSGEREVLYRKRQAA
jgi:hypothetical protein